MCALKRKSPAAAGGPIILCQFVWLLTKRPAPSLDHHPLVSAYASQQFLNGPAKYGQHPLSRRPQIAAALRAPPGEAASKLASGGHCVSGCASFARCKCHWQWPTAVARSWKFALQFAACEWLSAKEWATANKNFESTPNKNIPRASLLREPNRIQLSNCPYSKGSFFIRSLLFDLQKLTIWLFSHLIER